MTEETESVTEELMIELARRAALLDALNTKARDATELAESLPMSRSTIHRATQSLEQAGVLRKEGDKFTLTGFGEVAADETYQFQTNVRTARCLDEFLNVIEAKEVDIPLNHFTDAEILRPQPRQAHFGVDRIIELIEKSESLRVFSSIISPLYVNVAHREMMNGMAIEAIFDTSLVDLLASEYADQATEALESGNFTLYIGDGIPFELFIYDNTVAISAHDDSALPRMFVETDAPGAINWAENMYSRYKNEAWKFECMTSDLSPPVVPDLSD